MYYVYILTNPKHTVLYTGITNDLIRRVEEHRSKLKPNSFTARYNVHELIFFETNTQAEAAIAREKQIKSWSRKKKEALIETINPLWVDLFQTLQ